MKKLFNFLLFFLLTAVALPATATTVTVMTDVSSGLSFKKGDTSVGVNPTWITGSDLGHSLKSREVGTLEVDKQWLLINYNTSYSIKVNGQSMTNVNGSTSRAKCWAIKLANYSDPILVEIYSSSSVASSNPFTYPVYFDVTDEGNGFQSIVSATNGTVTTIPSSLQFKYNEKITLNSLYKAASYSLTGKNTTVTEKGSYSYEFTPFPSPDANTPKFSIVIPSPNKTYSLTTSADDAAKVLAYQLGSETPTESAPDYKAEEKLTVYTLAEPWSAIFDGALVSFAPTTLNGTKCYKATLNMPAANSTLSLRFNSTYTLTSESPNLILGCTVTDYQGNVTPLSFSNGSCVATVSKSDLISVYTKYVPTESEPSRTFTATTYNGVSCFTASFAPAEGGKQTLDFPTGSFILTIQDDEDKLPEIWPYIAGYQVTHDDGTVEDLHHKYNTDPEKQFSDYGSCATEFSPGDTYTLYLRCIPQSITLNGVDLTYEEYIQNDETFYKYAFTPVNEGYLNVTFGSISTTDPDTPNTEETFKVYIKCDRAGVVNAQVRTNTGKTDIVIGEEYTEVECPAETGYIYCTILDESMYSYQEFKNEDENVNFLDYDPPTTYPVTIRKTRATSDTDMIDNSGDHFSITTNTKADLKWYALNLNVADDDSNVQVEIGTSNKANSQANHKVEIKKGDNTINYSEEDTYLVVTSKDLRSLYQVTSTVGTVTKTEVWPAEFYLPLTADNDGSTVVVTANEPIEEGDKTFTLVIDRPELVTTVRRFVGGSLQSYTDYENFEETNSIDFTTGDQFRIFVNNAYAADLDYVKQNDIVIEPWNGMYEFTPADGDVITVYFGELPVAQTFTVITDDPANVSNVSNYTRDSRVWSITEQFTDVEFFAGDEFRISLGSRSHKYIRFNDVDVAYDSDNNYYYFNPVAGGSLKIIFASEPTPPVVVRTFTLNVDDASQIEDVWDNEADESLITDDFEFVNGANDVPFGSGSISIYVNREATLVTLDGEAVDMTTSKRDKYYELTGISETSVVNMKFAVDPKMTVYTDAPAKITDSNLPALTLGKNQFNIESDSYSFKADNAVAVKLNDTALEATDGTYSFTAADGDVLKVFFAYEPLCTGDLYTVTANFANEGTEGFINYVYVEDENGKTTMINDVTPFLTGNVLVDKDSEVGFNYKQDDYHIHGITINEVAQSAPYNGVAKFRLTGNSVVVFDVNAPETRNFTINVTNGRELDVVVTHLIPGTPEILDLLQSVEGEEPVVVTDFSVNSLHPYISVAKVEGLPITVAITDAAGNSYALNSDIEVTDGMVLNITVADVAFDKTLTVNLSNLSGTDKGDKIVTASGREFTLAEGDNTIAFNAEYDGLMCLSFSPITVDDVVELNGEALETDPAYLNMMYSFTPAAGDVLTIVHPALKEDASFLVIVEGTLKGDKLTSNRGREITLDAEASRIEVSFNEINEDTFVLEFEDAAVADNLLVYLNNAPLTATDGKFTFEVKANDILRIYHPVAEETVAAPEVHEVEIEVPNVLAGSVNLRDAIKFYREGVQWVNYSDNATFGELHGTLYLIMPPEGVKISIKVENKSNEAAAPAHVIAREPAEEGEGTTEDTPTVITGEGTFDVPSYGSYIELNGDKKITILYKDGTTAIDGIATDAKLCGDVYNMQGVLIKTDATAADLKHLPAGFYIVGGNKVIVK